MYNYNYRELFHYGMPKRSGRYPYGSGERPFQSEQKKRINESRRKIIGKELDTLRSKKGRKKYPYRLRSREALAMDVEDRVYEKLFKEEKGRTIDSRKIIPTEDQYRDKMANRVSNKVLKDIQKQYKNGNTIIQDIISGKLDGSKITDPVLRKQYNDGLAQLNNLFRKRFSGDLTAQYLFWGMIS